MSLLGWALQDSNLRQLGYEPRVLTNWTKCPFNAGSETWTRTRVQPQRILSPLCLPIPPYPHIQFCTYSTYAGDGGRTRTVLLPRDFKSLASAYSATPAYSIFTLYTTLSYRTCVYFLHLSSFILYQIFVSVSRVLSNSFILT